MSPVLYDPFSVRFPDNQYKQGLSNIMTYGRTRNPIQGGRAKSLPGMQFRFLMKNGFTLITERDASGIMKGALGELAGFLNGARTLDELETYGCPRYYWERWVTREKCEHFGLSEGDLGSASYGALWHSFPSRDGTPFNQIENLVRQMREKPELLTHRIVPWYPPEIIGPQGTRRVVVAPCHGDVQVTLFPETHELILDHVQRSGDVPVGIVNNLVQYAALGMILAKLTGYTFTEYVFTIRDAHIYECQYDAVAQLLSADNGTFPTVTLSDDAPDDIFAFRPHHFVLSDYFPNGPKMKIATPT